MNVEKKYIPYYLKLEMHIYKDNREQVFRN